MKSIRTYLLLSLLAIITLVTFVSLLQGYQSSITKAQQLFDERLQSLAEIIANANQDLQPRVMNTSEHSSTIFFQIWSSEYVLLVHSSNAPKRLLSNIDETEYKNINLNGYRWRIFILKDATLNRWIITGEREDIRYNLAENIVTASIVPIVLAIPVAGFIIWWAIGLGLKPLRNLTEQLNNKQADDLSPIQLKELPIELTQLVTTTNALFNRLSAAFIREQQFSADAAHELRTPISVLKVQIHNLQINDLSNNKALQPLADGIERMGHVIEQILSLYRQSPEQATLKQTEIDLHLIAQQVIANDYGKISTKNQQISLAGDEQCMLKGSTFALETLLQNLISNASKYTPEYGEIMVNIDQASSTVNLTIEDSGPGIDDVEYNRVFERFYRVCGDRHDSGALGCGLGLAIVKHIVDLHAGHIKLERSIEYGGLKVIINFPQIYTRNNG